MVMEVGTMQNINFIRFSELYNWSVSHLLGQDFEYNKNFPLVKIGKFLTKNNNVINLDNDTIYKRVTVSGNNGGVRLRNTEIGKNIGTKRQFIVKSGQFILSKIDARNGAMGLIPEDLEGAIVTNDFPTYDVDTTAILPQFLLLITTTKKFIEFAQTCSSGTTNRQRIDLKKFLDVQIPLPPLNDADAIKQGLSTDITQEKLIAEYNQKIKEAEQAKQNAIDKEVEIQTYLYDQLGLKKIEKKEANKGLTFVRFKDLSFWSLDTIFYSKSSRFNQKKIGLLCDISSGGTPSRSRSDYFGGNIPWIKTGELNNEVLTNTSEFITDKGLKNSSAKLYDEGSVVMAMYGATIGKTAKLGVKATTNQACAVMYNFSNEIVNDYLWIYLQSQTEVLKSMAYGSAQPNINARMIYDLEIPIPSIKEQNNLIKEFFNRKEKLNQLYLKAANFKEQAIVDFESVIFKNNK